MSIGEILSKTFKIYFSTCLSLVSTSEIYYLHVLILNWPLLNALINSNSIFENSFQIFCAVYLSTYQVIFSPSLSLALIFFYTLMVLIRLSKTVLTNSGNPSRAAELAAFTDLFRRDICPVFYEIF